MFDDSFERSALYFSVLQLLRIFTEWIHGTGRDLELCATETSESNLLNNAFEPEELEQISKNWKIITSHYSEVERRLLLRIGEKTEEVKSLRDGVSSNLLNLLFLRLTMYLSFLMLPRYSRHRNQLQ